MGSIKAQLQCEGDYKVMRLKEIVCIKYKKSNRKNHKRISDWQPLNKVAKESSLQTVIINDAAQFTCVLMDHELRSSSQKLRQLRSSSLRTSAGQAQRRKQLMAFSASIWSTWIQYQLALRFPLLPWHWIKPAGYLPTPAGNPSLQSSPAPSLSIFKPQWDPEKPDISLGLGLLTGGSNIDLPVVCDCHLHKCPLSHLHFLNPWLNSGIPSQKHFNSWIQDTWLDGSVSSQHRHSVFCKQRNSEQTIRTQINNPLLINVLRALALFLKWPLITHLFMFWKGEKNELGNCKGTKTKAISDKEFC